MIVRSRRQLFRGWSCRFMKKQGSLLTKLVSGWLCTHKHAGFCCLLKLEYASPVTWFIRSIGLSPSLLCHLGDTFIHKDTLVCCILQTVNCRRWISCQYVIRSMLEVFCGSRRLSNTGHDETCGVGYREKCRPSVGQSLLKLGLATTLKTELKCVWPDTVKRLVVERQ
ncbi:hypothetical protein AAHA92_08027 [Salvia divinorum]|uniref:Uncharacterized protein n=1 Tax=Salvia divinorum TaxID=28513 RepID=A0ABD1HLW4_SALDI